LRAEEIQDEGVGERVAEKGRLPGPAGVEEEAVVVRKREESSERRRNGTQYGDAVAVLRLPEGAQVLTLMRRAPEVTEQRRVRAVGRYADWRGWWGER